MKKGTVPSASEGSSPPLDLDFLSKKGGRFCKKPSIEKVDQFLARIARLRECALVDRGFDNSETYSSELLCQNPPLYYLIHVFGWKKPSGGANDNTDLICTDNFFHDPPAYLGTPECHVTRRNREYIPPEEAEDAVFFKCENERDHHDMEGGILLQCWVETDAVFEGADTCFNYIRRFKQELTVVLENYYPTTSRNAQMKRVLLLSLEHLEDQRFQCPHPQLGMTDDEAESLKQIGTNREWVYQAFVVDFYLSKLADSRRFEDGFIEVAAQHKTKGNSKH